MLLAGSGVYTNESYPLDEIFRVFMPVSVGCLPNSEVTIPKWLRNASHAYSALVGKYHCGSNIKGGCAPTQAGGFDYYFGLLNSHEEGEAGPCNRHVRGSPQKATTGARDSPAVEGLALLPQQGVRAVARAPPECSSPVLVRTVRRLPRPLPRVHRVPSHEPA